jgi:hypothetical protein
MAIARSRDFDAAAGLLRDALALREALALRAALLSAAFFSRARPSSARLLADALYLGVFAVEVVVAFRARDFLVVDICDSA